MFDSNQSTTPLFLERVSNRSGRNRVFQTPCIIPVPLLFAEVPPNPKIGIIGNRVDNLLKATLTLPDTSSWIMSEISDAIGCFPDAGQLVEETSFFPVGWMYANWPSFLSFHQQFGHNGTAVQT
jgi:hypothetical protein